MITWLQHAPIIGFVLFVGTACGDTGEDRLSVPLELAGTKPGVVSQDAWQIELTRADLAFGPLFLCAGEQAGELCDIAKAEWVDSAVVNVIDTKSTRAGELQGTSGEVRSFMYDFGIVSLLTQEQPLMLASANQLGGKSVVVEGTATRDTASYRFSLGLVVAQGPDTEVDVPVVRKKLTESFEHSIAEGQRLRLRFDSATWLEDVDFQAIYDEAGCIGACSEVLVLASDTQAGRALRNSLLLRARPAFEWR